MAQEQTIVEEFSRAGHVSEGEVYLPLAVARLLIERCSKAGVAIVGIETFELSKEGKLRPRVDLIADFSAVMDAALPWERKVRQTTSDAVTFVNSIIAAAPDLLANFVLKPSTDG